MSFGGGDDGGRAAREDRIAAQEQREAEAKALELENERLDAQALSEKQSLADKESARRKKQKTLSSYNDDDSTSLLG